MSLADNEDSAVLDQILVECGSMQTSGNSSAKNSSSKFKGVTEITFSSSDLMKKRMKHRSESREVPESKDQSSGTSL